ncbi:MAG: ribosomal protein L7/L12, partial [Chloroflexi bacterium]|nr:ribosomal protein L7/L12 [Chloroflexota bacterium]
MARLIRAGKKIEAIKIYRAIFGVGLKDAKDAVEALQAGKPVITSAPTPIITITHTPASKPSIKLWIALAIIFFFCPGIFFLPFLPFAALFGAFIGNEPDVPLARTPTRFAFASPPIAPTLTRVPSPTPTPGFMNVALKFGGSGTGPGLFTDARSIALDANGNLFVGEYTGGRVQVFDSTGKFSMQWNVDAQAPLRWLAADRKGTVYIAQKGVIEKFEGATGKSLGAVQFPDNRFDQVIALPDGGLLALWYESRNGLFTSAKGARDDLIR